jgi:hypothetical protein
MVSSREEQPLAYACLSREPSRSTCVRAIAIAILTTSGCGGGGAGERPDAGGAGVIDAGAGPWAISTAPTTPLPMDDVTVFAYSQTILPGRDAQLLALAPDISIRTWNQWDTVGTKAADFDPSYVTDCQAKGIRFMGGVAPTVFFPDQAASEAQLEDFTTRDANGQLVRHDSIVPDLRRGTLANPAFRDYVVSLSKIQIDAGVDGLHFDEVNGDYQGGRFDGDEGFDDYHLAEFNAYLLAKYPAGTDFASRFRMSPDNLLRPDYPPGDFVHNFRYRDYLRALGLSGSPLDSANPLIGDWGQHAYINRPVPGAATFVDAAEPYRYWKRIVDELRTYARDRYGREILISANGIFPFVDFQSVGLYDPNNDGPNGSTFTWMRLTSDGHLDGTLTWQSALRPFVAASAAFAPGAPVSLFMDGIWSIYDNLPPAERQDFWRIYSAEASASGTFLAFQLLTPFSSEPTATNAGVMPLFASLSAFYRAHRDLYHGVAPATVTATTTSGRVTLGVTDQATPHRRLVHVVNHDYAAGLVPHQNVSVTVPSETAPMATALVVSPDTTPDMMTVPVTYAAGQASVVVPSLTAYDVIVLSYP